MDLIFTDGKDERFITLCNELDNYLNEAVGGESQRKEYNQYNTLENIHDVVLVMKNGELAGCGSFKEYEPEVAEIKRVFVRESNRKQGVGKCIMDNLEKIAKDKGYKKLILETGRSLKPAINRYSSLGFKVIKNYGQYANMPKSICMKKFFTYMLNIYKRSFLVYYRNI